MFRKAESMAAENDVLEFADEIIRTAPMGVIVTNEGLVTGLNEAAARLLAQPRDRLMGASLAQLGLVSSTDEYSSASSDGTLLRIRQTTVSRAGRVLTALWLRIDGEAELRRRAATLTALFEDAPIGMYLKGTDGRYVQRADE
jgi:PAS domain-containing protein